MFSSALRTLMQQSDNFFISYFMNPSDVGIYDSAFTLSRTILLLSWTVGFLFLPIFTRSRNSRDYDENTIYQITTKWLAFFSTTLFTFFLIFGESSLRIIFGGVYTASSTSLVVIAGSFYLRNLLGPADITLISLGESKIILYVNILGALLNIVLGVILIPRYGIFGAAISLAIAFVLVNFCFAFLLYNRTGIIPIKVKILLTSLLIVTSGFMIRSIWSINLDSFIELSLAAVVVSVLILGTMVSITGLNETEEEMIQSIQNNYI
jgi:O-antigen/teichoic acid export membrane protein